MFRFFALLCCCSVINCTDIEDLTALFGNKHCIEASLVSISLKKSDPIILDSSTSVNATVADQGVTAKIHELAQYNNLAVIFKLISEEGLPHARIFTVLLTLGDETYEGTGPSLKTAKQSAAALALENTAFEHPPTKIKDEQEKSQTPTVVLNNIAMKLGVAVSYYLLNGQEEQSIDSYGGYNDAYGGSKSLYPKINSTFDPLRVPIEDAQVSGPFTVRVKVGNFVAKGVGHTVQGARHDAAFNAIKAMEKEALFKDNVCSKDESAEECKQKKESLKSPITRVHEAGQRYNLPVSFDLIGETGKSHKKIFTTQCTLGDFVTEAEGNSKKESKKLAAERMLKHFPALSAKFGAFNENGIVNGLSNKKKKKRKKMVRDTHSSNIIESMTSVMSSVWGSDSDSSSHAPTANTPKNSVHRSPKDNILEIGRKLNIPIEFTDLGKHGDEFVSLMALEVKPPHICLGKAATRETSHDIVALRGIKFLQTSGVYDKALFTQVAHSDEIAEYALEDEVVYERLDDATEK